MKGSIRIAIVAATCAVLCLARPVTAQDTVQVEPEVQTETLHGSGDWGEEKDALARVAQRWNVDALHYADDRISGRIAVSGSPLIESANVDGQLSGRGVRGKLLDDEGKELAEFDGQLTPAGAAGKYRALNGEVGDWYWEGPITPRAVAAQP